MVKCLLLIGMIEIDEAWMLIGLLTDIEEQRLAGGQGATLDVKMIASRLAHVINSQMLTET